MRKTTKERLKASLKRTILAVILIAIAVLFLQTGLHWRMWYPKDDWGVLMVLSMYAGGIVLFIYGIYMLSPIYIGTFIYLLLDEACKRIRISVQDEEENEDEDEKFLQKVKDMKKKYLW